jgi:hypothetical protein
MRLPSINPMQPCDYVSYVAKTLCFSIMGHQISSAMVEEARCNKDVIIIYCTLVPIP